MPTLPLTHHDIFALAEPFARRGHRLDLAVSDRMARRLVFKAVERAADGLPALREVLQLEGPDTGPLTLTRVLDTGHGLEARLQVEGPEPGELLARIEAVPPRRQLACGPGWCLALSHRMDLTAAGAPRLVLVAGAARIDRLGGLAVTLKLPRVSGIPADIEVHHLEGDAPDLPEDLLAVLGLAWSRLSRLRNLWQGHLRLGRSEPVRSRTAQERFESAVVHLAQTLAEPPGRFHERFAQARWAVVLRRATPLLVSVGLIAAAAAVPLLDLGEGSVLRMLIFNAPPLLLVLFFALPEMPRIEIPPWPRRNPRPGW